MIKVKVTSTRDKRNWGVIVYGVVLDGQPAGRMRLTLPVADRVTCFEVNGYGRSSEGANDILFTIPERDESAQFAIVDALREDEFVYLEPLPPALPGEPRASTTDVE